MSAFAFAQRRCRNHPAREAACRCPECRLDYCRECVTEHAGRLLCSGCIAKVSAKAGAGGGTRRRLRAVGVAAGGMLAAWLFFFLASEGAATIFQPHPEVRTWHAR